MLIYLNNEKSVGPNSKAGKRARGLNENLAREILELHTLGVDGGYSLDDIRQLAMAISGWSITDEGDTGHGGFKFRDKHHEPGARIFSVNPMLIMARLRGEAVLRDLARHRKTAEFISYKLAQHLIADQPPKQLVCSHDRYMD